LLKVAFNTKNQIKSINQYLVEVYDSSFSYWFYCYYYLQYLYSALPN